AVAARQHSDCDQEATGSDGFHVGFGGVAAGAVCRHARQSARYFGPRLPASASNNKAPVSMPDSSLAVFMVAGTRVRPLLNTARVATPNKVPGTDPVPPKMLVPPSTTAVMANSS